MANRDTLQLPLMQVGEIRVIENKFIREKE